jgi:hypothetical protein
MQLSKEFASQSREHNMSTNTLAIFSLQNLMRNSKNVLWFLALGLLLCTASLSAQEKNAPLENSDVIKLTASHFGDDLLLKIIDKSENHFDVSPTSLIALKKGGASDKVIAAMQDAVARKLAPPTSAAPSANLSTTASTAAPAASGANAVAGVTIPQLPTVSLLAGGSTSPMQPSIAQIAKTSAPQGLSAANPLSGSNPLGSLASQNMTFAALSTAANLIPMVRMATMAGKLFSSVGKSQQSQSPTFVWGLPSHNSSFVVPSSSPAFDVQYPAVAGIDPDAFEPVLVKLTPTSSNWRLVGAGSMIVGANGATALPKITEDRTPVKSTRLAPGHVRLEPTMPLAPGEYAIVLRPVAAQAAQSAQAIQTPQVPQALQSQNAQPNMSVQAAGMQQLFYAVWDFSVPTADKSQR